MALPVMLTSEATYARQELTAYLEAHGVETRPIVAGNLLRHPVAAGRLGVYCKGDFPGADEVHERGFYVGLTGLTTLEEIDRLTATFGAFLKHRV
jgi:dTDP-4-amino-4,6-dideoxygalactose transaminase